MSPSQGRSALGERAPGRREAARWPTFAQAEVQALKVLVVKGVEHARAAVKVDVRRAKRWQKA